MSQSDRTSFIMLAVVAVVIFLALNKPNECDHLDGYARQECNTNLGDRSDDRPPR